MRLIIAGSREGFTLPDLYTALSTCPTHWFPVEEVVSGGARGVDSLGIEWARENHVKYRVFPAQWNLYGRGAGMKRNRDMINCIQALRKTVVIHFKEPN